jgi:predicted metal-binding protein
MHAAQYIARSNISAENINMKKVSVEAGFRLRFDRKANECLAEIAR